MVHFYQNKGMDMLKPWSVLPNFANICLLSSTDAKFYPFTENEKDLLSNVWEDMFGGPSKVFTRRALTDETHIRNSTGVWKSTVCKKC